MLDEWVGSAASRMCHGLRQGRLRGARGPFGSTVVVSARGVLRWLVADDRSLCVRESKKCKKLRSIHFGPTCIPSVS